MAASLVYLVVALALPGLAVASHNETDSEFGEMKVTDVEAVVGTPARLVCDLALSVPGDEVWLVMWYCPRRETPCYSYDARERSEAHKDKSRHWVDAKAWRGGRVTFNEKENPPYLSLESAEMADTGVYRCRVDFANSPTGHALVNLTVVTPPTQVMILNQSGYEVLDGLVGPYNQDSTGNVTCVAYGGDPPPRVTWWLENALLDEDNEDVSKDAATNTLVVHNLDRKMHNAVLTCQASNTRQVAPLSTKATMQLNLKVTSVRLTNATWPLRADRQADIACSVQGSRPLPEITWWLGSYELTNARLSSEENCSDVTSVVTFIPRREDCGLMITCRARTPVIPDSGMENSVKINVTFEPSATVIMSPEIVDEGSGVALECNTNANPKVHKVVWLHNGNKVKDTPETVVRGPSLMLQNAKRSSAGSYVCMASNALATTASGAATLEVRFIPVCRGTPREIFVRPGATAEVQCPIITWSRDIVTFRWAFASNADWERYLAAANATTNAAGTTPKPYRAGRKNKKVPTTAATLPQPPHDAEPDFAPAVVNGTQHTINFTAAEFGTLLCWGKGSRGEMEMPCAIKISQAVGKPDAPSNCSVLDVTTQSATVYCAEEGYPGASPRTFVVEAYLPHDNHMLSNATNTTAFLVVENLPSGTNITLVTYAVNPAGRSLKRGHVHARTTGDATSLLGATSLEGTPIKVPMHLTGLLLLLACVVAALLLATIVIVTCLRMRGRGEGHDEKPPRRRRHCAEAAGSDRCAGDGGDAAAVVEGGDAGEAVVGAPPPQDAAKDESDPDVIPTKTDADYLDEEERAFQYLHQGGTRRQTNMASMQPLLPSNLCMNQPGGFNLAPLYGQPSMQLQQLQPLTAPMPAEYPEEYRTEFTPSYQPMYDAGQASYMYSPTVDQRFALPYQPEQYPGEAAYASMPRNAGTGTLKPLKPILKSSKPVVVATSGHSSTLPPPVQPWQYQVAGSLRKQPLQQPLQPPQHAHHPNHPNHANHPNHPTATSAHNPVIEPPKAPSRSSPPLSMSTPPTSTSGTCSSPESSEAGEAGSEREPLLWVNAEKT